MSQVMEAPSSTYCMPRIHLGQLVRWYNDRFTNDFAPALVTAIYNDAVDLSILVPGSATFLTRNGVRHGDYPNQQTLDLVGSGVWHHFPEADLVGELLAAVEALSQTVSDFQQRLQAAERKNKEVA